MTASLLPQPTQQLLEINKGRYVWLSSPITLRPSRPRYQTAIPNPPDSPGCFWGSAVFVFFSCHLFSISSPAAASDHGTSQACAPIHFICHYLMVMTPKKSFIAETHRWSFWVVFSLCTLHLYPKAREIKGMCLMEVSLGEISRAKNLDLLTCLQFCTHKATSTDEPAV